MDNAYIGTADIKIGRQTLTLCFDWRALAAIKTRFGGKMDLGSLITGTDPDALAALIAIGLERHHPGWTAERVSDASPPLMPTVAAVEKAINYAYFGQAEPPKAEPANPPIRRLMRWAARLVTRSQPRSASPTG
jgi:hypothetical protein